MKSPTGFIVFPFIALTSWSADWHQGSGPTGNFQVAEDAPLAWSVALDHNVSWKLALPETGQSTPVIAKGKLFFTTFTPVEMDSTLGKDIQAWCCDASTGNVDWKREIPGTHPLRLSGCFSDSSAPPAVCDGKRVVFLNASGAITCFDLDGKKNWSQPFLSVGRSLPFLHESRYVYTRQIYPPEPSGNFPHKYADSPKDMWTQLQALDMKTGEIAWTSECGVNMGISTLPQIRADGRGVAVVGRGGGHGPPERPFGISMVDLKDGKTLWTLPIEGFMATMSYRLHRGRVHIFHGGEHLSVDEMTGEVVKRVSIVGEVSVCRMKDGLRHVRKESLGASKKNRMITQGSNLLAGRHHYFRSYVRPWLGRVDVESGAVEYLELPLQVSRVQGKADEFQWFLTPMGKKGPAMKDQSIASNDMKNSRGFKVVGDKRSHGNGWGHVASPTPSVAGDHLYVPVMNGTVYVIALNSSKLDEDAIVAINDLGPAGRSWTRASISFANGRAFAHTIRELICIGE
jgi:outer membrane protein assembly factor BamB